MEAATGKVLPEGVWTKGEAVTESVIHSEYHGMSISLLIYPDDPPAWGGTPDEDALPPEDTFSRMTR